MALENTERLYLERQVTLGRAILVALSLVALLETAERPVGRIDVLFLSTYLIAAIAAVIAEHLSGKTKLHIPLAADFAILVLFLILTPSASAFWFLFLFSVFALATQGKTRAVPILVSIATAGALIRVGFGEEFHWQSVWHWVVISIGMLVSGLGMGFLGAREREQLSRQRFLEEITAALDFDRGLTESVRVALGELLDEFSCDVACLAVRDEELERIFVWKLRPGDATSQGPDTLPLERGDTFLLDSLEVSIGWEFANGEGRGFGWDRRTGWQFREIPAPSGATQKEFGTRFLLASTVELDKRPAGRVLLARSEPQAANARHSSHRFTPKDLRWLDQIVRHFGPPLENLFLLRNLRTRAVEAERSRISRDLHDGILQTLLSLKIQLNVLRGKLPESSNGLGAELGNLQKMIQEESDELRRMVTEMRPLRVESADMRELMFGFAERFRSEQDLAIDLFVEDRNLRLPDRVCRELFQIYRESIHNVKKHAHASHVVVKLGQDETKVYLVIDDNGRGFSFSGTYSSEELDKLRLGPISIKERTRGVGGTLTVESNPGHGARLTVEIPLN
ncbi:MAG TPA: sensor histidine kinase [Candidatus Aquilonibacter sp.]|nr:sensor histidine kinase [Candidatus Aquilonibacter sp.]